MNQIILIAVFILNLFIGGCIDDLYFDFKPVKENEEMNSEQLKYLALGDSYTIGESVDTSLRWPVQLVDRLRDQSINIEDAEIIARTGWTTDELKSGIEAASPEYNYDLVSLLIGVNNQYRGRGIDNFREEFSELLELALAFAGDSPENLIVLSIPDWGVMPFAGNRDRAKIAGEIDEFNRVVREECSEMGINFFDITDISRKASNDPSLVADDGLHPSGKMYGLWVDRIYSYVYDLLKENK